MVAEIGLRPSLSYRLGLSALPTGISRSGQVVGADFFRSGEVLGHVLLEEEGHVARDHSRADRRRGGQPDFLGRGLANGSLIALFRRQAFAMRSGSSVSATIILAMSPKSR